MNTDKNPLLTTCSVEVSLVRGGLFYRAQHAIGLIRPNRWNLVRRITILLAIGWLPLFLITAITNPDAMLSLLKDYRVHSRILVAVPVLLIAEVLMDGRSFWASFTVLSSTKSGFCIVPGMKSNF